MDAFFVSAQSSISCLNASRFSTTTSRLESGRQLSQHQQAVHLSRFDTDTQSTQPSPSFVDMDKNSDRPSALALTMSEHLYHRR